MWPIWREPDEFLETALDVFGCRHCRVIIHGIDGFSTDKKCNRMCVVAREEERSCEKKGNQGGRWLREEVDSGQLLPLHFKTRAQHSILKGG